MCIEEQLRLSTDESKGKLSLRRLANPSFHYEEKLGFRNKYNRRYSPKIEHGLTGLASPCPLANVCATGHVDV